MNIGEALRRTLALIQSSHDSLYAPEGVEQIANDLGVAIAALDSGRTVDRAGLALLFAPTGSIQEISLANRWSDEFLSLSHVVDGFLAHGETPGER